MGRTRRSGTIIEQYEGERSRSSSLSSAIDECVPMEMDLTGGGPPDDDIASISRAPETCWQVISRYARLILPHIGLVLLLTMYTLIGAGIFHVLEVNNERKTRQADIRAIAELRRGLVNTLWDLTNDNTTSIDKDDFRRASESYFDELATVMFVTYRHQFITDEDLRNKTQGTTWNFANSIFFATTVITTIGYGNLAPITTYGRIFCIFFGIFGIPLLLVTIADIGKFLSEFLSFLYRSYRGLKRKLRRQSRKLSFRWSRSSSPEKMATLTAEHLREDASDLSSEDELRIPVIMVGLVLVVYMAIGGFLFQNWEGWKYFDAFYFCFITMATIGFGDMVPTSQMYMFFTMAYIMFGLALTTMLIDLAGTEYIRKIHYVGQKIETAKTVMGGALASGFHTGEHLLRSRYGVIRTAGGKLVHVGRVSMTAAMAREYGMPEFILDEEKNILYEPLSQNVLRHASKAGVKIMPDQISDTEGYVLSNRMPRPKHKIFQSPNAIHRTLVPKSFRRPGDDPVILIAPFVLKESHV